MNVEPPAPEPAAGTAPAAADEPDPVAATSLPEARALVGSWVSSSVDGPGSAHVHRVEFIFELGGTFSGTMLSGSGRRRFESTEGTWKLHEAELTVTFRDGRVRTWLCAWEGETLSLRDGDSGLWLVPAAR